MSKVLFQNCKYLVTHPSPDSGIIGNGAIYIEGPLIVDVGPSAELSEQYAGKDGVEIVDASAKVVMPGLVDAHNHVGEAHTLLIYGWLDTPITGIVDATDRIYWPAHGWLDEESVYDLTMLGLLHLLKHGATTHANAMPFPEATYQASVQARLRTVIHPQVISSVRLPDAENEEEYLSLTEESIRNFHNSHDGLIQVGVHPNQPYNCSRDLLLECMALAEQYDVQFATHVADCPDEKDVADRILAEHGGLIRYLEGLGLITSRTLLFHGTLLEENEIDLLTEAGAALVHCPGTNALFGYCAYLPYMLKAGLRVGLGTDCVTHNLFNVMLAVLQHHNFMPREMRGLDPWVPFELATVGGARALGLDDKIGTIEAGKRADIITIDLRDNTSLFPLSSENLLFMLALNGAGTEVSDAMVDGVFLRRDRQFTFLDEEAILARAQARCDQFSLDYFAAKQQGRSLFRRVREEFQFF